MALNMILYGSASKRLESAGLGGTKTSEQKKISLLAVALLEANAKYGTLIESQNGL